MNYRNEWAEAKDVDPRKKLQELLRSNMEPESIGKVTHDLRGYDVNDKLEEYVKTTNPYDILENCFVAYDLQRLAVEKLEIDANLNLEGRKLVSAMLDKLGFKTEVKPMGLSQIREDVQSSLNRAESNVQLSLDDISGILSGMARTLEKLLRTLFLFYSHTLLPFADEKASDIQRQCQQYRKKRAKSLGHYLVFLRNLMDYVQGDADLIDYCRKNFQSKTPMNQNHIAELRMFAVYRNLITSHDPDAASWEMNKQNAERRLQEMDAHIREKWEDSWHHVIESQKSQSDFPRREMLSRAVVFFKEFFNSLAGGIYPKVIVMRTSTVDDYGIRQIAADDGSDETIFLTDCDFEPFTELYCHSRTNPIGIEPILVSKKVLKDWATPPDGNTEN